LAGVLLVLLAAAGAVGLLIAVRRRPHAPAVATRVQTWTPRGNGDSGLWSQAPSELPPLSDDPLGRLSVTAGPNAGGALEVGTRPRRIGSAPHCDLVLTDDDGTVGPEEARVWVSEGRLMYHKLTRLTTFATEGPAGGWYILQDGDEIRVGPHRLVFELLAPSGVTEALAKLEQPEEQEAPTPESMETPAPMAGRRRKGSKVPELDDGDDDDPIARQAAAWLKREAERKPEPEPVPAPDDAAPDVERD
jgi:predicted component of type VI protein secretion system